MIREVGDTFEIEYQARTPDGVLTDTTMALALTVPSGSSTDTTPTPTKASTGTYRYGIPLDVAGEFRWKWTASGTIADVASGSVLAVAAAPLVYASRDDLKLWIAGRAAGSTTSLAMGVGEDALLDGALRGASRGIDNRCGAPARRFYLDATASARVFAPAGRTVWEQDLGGDLLLVDDLGATGYTVEIGTAGVDDWTELDSSQFEEWPLGALDKLRPIEGLVYFGYRWRITPRTRIRITARWGWPAVPDVVHQATLIQGARLFARRKSPEGILGNADWGGAANMARVDPDVRQLLNDFALAGF